MGRPKKDYQFYSLRLRKDIYQFLKEKARKEETTMTKLIEQAAVEKYNIPKEKNNGDN